MNIFSQRPVRSLSKLCDHLVVSIDGIVTRYWRNQSNDDDLDQFISCFSLVGRDHGVFRERFSDESWTSPSD